MRARPRTCLARVSALEAACTALWTCELRSLVLLPSVPPAPTRAPSAASCFASCAHVRAHAHTHMHTHTAPKHRGLRAYDIRAWGGRHQHTPT